VEDSCTLVFQFAAQVDNALPILAIAILFDLAHSDRG
jgi:hypothetical protein